MITKLLFKKTNLVVFLFVMMGSHFSPSALAQTRESTAAQALGEEPTPAATGGVSSCLSCQLQKNPKTHPKAKNQKDLKSLYDEVLADWSDSPAIKSYSESPKVKKMIDVALARANGNFNSGECYAYVRRAMVAAGFLTPSQLHAGKKYENARQAVEEGQLPGYINLMKDPRYANRLRGGPEFAPCGALLVYSHGRRPGHVEIKTCREPYGYVSSFKHHRSVVGDILNGQSGRQYTLIGVMVLAPKEDSRGEK